MSSGAQRSLDGGGVGAQASIDVGPAWSRDGRWIAYTKYPIGSERETWVIEPSGAHRRRLATTNRFEDTIALSFIPQWTPDSRAVIALDISLAGDASAQARLVRMLVDTPTEPVKQPLTPRESVAKAWGALSPAVSPDGHWIAYVDDRWGGQSHLHRVYVAAMDGTHNPPVAFPRRANDPKWIDDLDPAWRPSLGAT